MHGQYNVKYSQFVTSGWSTEGRCMPGSHDVECIVSAAILVRAVISLRERAEDHSTVLNVEYRKGSSGVTPYLLLGSNYFES
jgi:hypothetical protein